MGGSVYFVAVTVAVGIVLAVLVSPLFIIPAVVLVLVGLFAAPLLAAIARGSGGGDAGATTTGEASYEPVATPEDRRG